VLVKSSAGRLIDETTERNGSV